MFVFCSSVQFACFSDIADLLYGAPRWSKWAPVKNLHLLTLSENSKAYRSVQLVGYVVLHGR